MSEEKGSGTRGSEIEVARVWRRSPGSTGCSVERAADRQQTSLLTCASCLYQLLLLFVWVGEPKQNP